MPVIFWYLPPVTRDNTVFTPRGGFNTIEKRYEPHYAVHYVAELHIDNMQTFHIMQLIMRLILRESGRIENFESVG